MEGCPRSLMLNVDLKETFPTEFTPSLKSVKQDKCIDFIIIQFRWPETSKYWFIFSIFENTTTRMPTRTRTNVPSWNNFVRYASLILSYFIHFLTILCLLIGFPFNVWFYVSRYMTRFSSYNQELFARLQGYFSTEGVVVRWSAPVGKLNTSCSFLSNSVAIYVITSTASPFNFENQEQGLLRLTNNWKVS